MFLDMEAVPRPEQQMEGGTFDREAIVEAAAETAKSLVAERVVAEVPEERYEEYKELMEELAADNGNRFIVEAIAQRLSLEKAAQELRDLEARYPLAA